MNEMLTSIKRTPYQSLASFLILFFTLFLSLFFFNLTAFLNGLLNFVETRPSVIVYFQKQTSEGDVFKVRNALYQTGKADSIHYTSKSEALQNYKQLNRDKPQLLEMVTADILPPSLEIYAKKPEYLSELAEYLKKQPGVEEVHYQKDLTEQLLRVTNVLKKTFLFIMLFLILTSFVVLMTTTAFKITLKRPEIELLSLLGASKGYIRRPFLYEGSVFGVVAATAAFVLYYLIFLFMSSFLSSFLSGLQLSFYSLSSLRLYVWPPSIEYIGLSYGLLVLFGLLIGIIGNFFATRKYIK